MEDRMCPPQVTAALSDCAVSRRNLLKLGIGVATAAAAALVPQTAGAVAVKPTRFSNLADLTHVLGPNTPSFDGQPAFSITTAVTHAANGYFGSNISYWEHMGTHMDAPVHFSPSGLYVDQIAPTNLVVPAVVIDIRTKVARDPDAVVTPDDIVAYERRYGRIPANAAVLMSSDWGTRIGSQEAYRNADSSGVMHFPGFGKAAIDMLLNERSIAGIGVDTLSLDHGPSADFAVHYSFLATNRWGLENLANLSAIPPAGATLIVGAPKIAGGSGGPCRIMAVW
jgi:kynurenine formamidase